MLNLELKLLCHYSYRFHILCDNLIFNFDEITRRNNFFFSVSAIINIFSFDGNLYEPVSKSQKHIRPGN